MKAWRALAKVQAQADNLGLEGCAACRHRRGVPAFIREGRGDALPPPCRLCGDAPETVIVEVVVTTREEAQEALRGVKEAG